MPEITYEFKVTKVFPTFGSLNGGTSVTLLGDGFPDDMENITVSFEETPCHLKSTSASELVCEMGHGKTVHRITNKGEYPGIIGNNCQLQGKRV